MIYDFKKLNDFFLSDPYSKIVYSSAKDIEVYIVGGYIRDVMIGRNVMDRDYVVKGDLKIVAAKIAAKTNGKLIKIGKGNLYRILLENGVNMDFTPMDQDIEKNLSERDFTINAMAWSPKTGLIDLYSGVRDVEKGLIRVIKNENLRSDPVRIIRAYRIAGDTSFEIDENTIEIFKENSDKIKGVKTERITLEIFKILNLFNPFKPLKMMVEHMILTKIICLSNKELLTGLKAINELNRTIDEKPFKNLLKPKDIFSQGLSHIGLLRLEILLRESPETLLNLSSKIKKRQAEVEKATKIMRAIKGDEKGALYYTFRIARSASVDFLIINNMQDNLPDLQRFKEIDKNSLLSVKEILEILKIDRGIMLGKAIDFIKKAEFCRKITTKGDAVELLKREFKH